eukprot:Gregarina_sp_Poly_1__9020@NODE_54_length_17501_cov_44_565045_g46_i0_p4_GENE_NODE_54_length_17501_cov_44_565045_g46_i0NODE_54_length_17501_cov_44_565045_g46_i0_p4_ORF_typecomplete_len435_score62_76ANAPC4_WD40/PF12894_7/3_1e03ANAPC4_WD40/PF12894_7/0_0042ANAPC4_WD40/PF12894_7/2_3e09ANAPC4_WD40/PF12894_7/5_1e05ANAPC4_WD40/PF12894_7/0_049ANAPC4_WD40/PF12894_7/9_4e06ANAPC4_WD40/PF12894_7/3_4e03WD40/PF00400_32/5_2e02WD40/PF00400_32/0_00028WD40/PF00400_32/6_1e06WD40/PF00400_32/0_74WD40/PF00400_32/1_8e02
MPGVISEPEPSDGPNDEPFPQTPPPAASSGNLETSIEGTDVQDLGRVPNYFWECPEVAGVDNQAVYCFAPVSVPDGRLFMAAGGGDELLRILELRPVEGNAEVQSSGVRVLNEFKLHTDSIAKCCLSCDNSLLAAASLDGTISVYQLNLESSEQPLDVQHVATLEGPNGEIEDCVWSPKGRLILATSSDGTAWIWHASRGYHGVLVGHGDVVTRGAFISYLDEQGKETIQIVTSSLDGFVIVWDPESCVSKHKVEITESDTQPMPIVAMATHSTEPLIVCGTVDGCLHLIQASTGQKIRKAKLFEGEVTDVQFAPAIVRQETGDLLLAASDSRGVIKIIDCSTFATRHVVHHGDQRGEAVEVNHLCWAPMWPPALVSAGENGTLCIWDPRNGQLVDKLLGRGLLVSDLQVFPVNSALLIGAGFEEGEINLWQLH